MFNHKPWILPFLTELNDDTGRWYIKGDIKYQSVTSYISQHWDKSGLDVWRAKIGTKEAEHQTEVAADRGRLLHGGIEGYLKNDGLPKYQNPHNQILFLKVLPHLDRIDNIRCIESPLCSDEWKLGGRPDCIAEYNDSLSVIDIKTSGRVKQEKYIVSYYLQCGFYGQMARELYGETAENAVIIMATEDSPHAQIFTLDMNVCIGMAKSFRSDPVAFQKKMKKLQRAMGTAAPK